MPLAPHNSRVHFRNQTAHRKSRSSRGGIQHSFSVGFHSCARVQTREADNKQLFSHQKHLLTWLVLPFMTLVQSVHCMLFQGSHLCTAVSQTIPVGSSIFHWLLHETVTLTSLSWWLKKGSPMQCPSSAHIAFFWTPKVLCQTLAATRTI